MRLSVSQRAELFNKFGGMCAYCGNPLPARGWHADHIEAVMRDSKWVKVEGKPYTHKMVQTGTVARPENQRLDNFNPACRTCNIDKSCMDLESWRDSIQRRVEVCRRNHAAFRHVERFGLVAQVKTAVTFYFETLADSESKPKGDT